MDQHSLLIQDLFGYSEDEEEVADYDRAIENTLIAAAAAALAPPQALHSPLPPDTPFHPESSQLEHGDRVGFAPAQGPTIPNATVSTQQECTAREWDEESSFTRWPKDDSAVVHRFDATENSRGLQTVLALKSSRCPFLDESGIFPEFNPTVNKIEASRPGGKKGIYAFMQSTTRGYGFRKHDNAPAKSTLVLTSRSYVALLRFFEKEWKRVESKMRSELESMQQLSCGINICKGLSFYGSGVSRYQKLLENYGDFGLFLVVSVDSTTAAKGDKPGTGKIFVQAKYKKNPSSTMPEADVKSLGEIDLPIEALEFFAKSRTQLEWALQSVGSEDEGDKENRANINSVQTNKDFSELASQIRHPIPQVELKMQSAASKILEYASGSGVPRNQLTAEEAKNAKSKAEKKLAPPFLKKPAATSLLKSQQPKKVTSNVSAPRPTLEELINRGISDVSGDKDKRSSASSCAQPAKKRPSKASTDKEDCKIPKNKKMRV